MPNLDALLDRPGLPPTERLLVKIKAAVWPGDADIIAECIHRCRELDQPRMHVEEVLLQAVLFCGFPRVINAFRVLADEWPVQTRPTGGAVAADAQRDAGYALFQSIYGTNSKDVESMLLGYHEELHEFVMDTAYGRILSRPGLSPRLRELLAIGVLALTDQVPQLIAHGRGARSFGASSEQIREAVYTGCDEEVYAEKMLRKIERIRAV